MARWSIRRSRQRSSLAKEKIETTVVNARFVKPLDAQLLLALARTKRLIVTVEEAYLAGGFGSAVMELLEENGLQDKVRVVRMGIPDRLVTHGDAKLLLAKYGLDADGIYNRVKESIDVLDDRRAKPQKVSPLARLQITTIPRPFCSDRRARCFSARYRHLIDYSRRR